MMMPELFKFVMMFDRVIIAAAMMGIGVGTGYLYAAIRQALPAEELKLQWQIPRKGRLLCACMLGWTGPKRIAVTIWMPGRATDYAIQFQRYYWSRLGIYVCLVVWAIVFAWPLSMKQAWLLVLAIPGLRIVWHYLRRSFGGLGRYLLVFTVIVIVLLGVTALHLLENVPPDFTEQVLSLSER